LSGGGGRFAAEASVGGGCGDRCVAVWIIVCSLQVGHGPMRSAGWYLPQHRAPGGASRP
jgi:hypothetical protein